MLETVLRGTRHPEVSGVTAGFRAALAAGPADVGLPRPPQVPSGMVPDADGMLPTTAALKNPSADIL